MNINILIWVTTGALFIKELLIKNKTLKVLDLASNIKLDNNGVELVVEGLVQNSTLAELWLQGCALSAQGVYSLYVHK